MMAFLLVIGFLVISFVCMFLYLYMLVSFHVIIAGLQCISMLPALWSCKVLVLVVFCKFLTAFVQKGIFIQFLILQSLLKALQAYQNLVKSSLRSIYRYMHFFISICFISKAVLGKAKS